MAAIVVDDGSLEGLGADGLEELTLDDDDSDHGRGDAHAHSSSRGTDLGIGSGAGGAASSASVMSSIGPDDAALEDEVRREEEDVRRLIDVSVLHPQPQAGSLLGHVLYDVVTKTSLSQFAAPEFGVKRRYSDFLWLREELTILQPGCIIPSLPEKQMINRFSEPFLEKRRKQLELFLRRVCEHVVLRHQDCFRDFLQSEVMPTEHSRDKGSSAEREVPASTKNNFLSGLTAAVKSSVKHSLPESLGGAHVREIDNWFEEQKRHVTDYQAKLQQLQLATAGLRQQTDALTDAYNVFSNACTETASCEASATADVQDRLVRKGLEELGVLSHEIVGCSKDLSCRELAEADQTLLDYLRQMVAVQELLDRRDERLGAYQRATRVLEEKRQNSKATPLDISTLEGMLARSKADFEGVSEQARIDLARFYRFKSADMRSLIRKVAKTHMDHSVRVNSLWKQMVGDQFDAVS